MKNLNYVVNLVQMDREDYSTHSIPRILQYCIHAYKNELGYRTSKSVKVAYLQLNDVKNAPYPKDYEYYTKIAINFGGQYITLTRNPRIPLIRKTNDCGLPEATPIDVPITNIDPWLYTYGYYYAPHYRNGQYVGEMYSLTGGYNEAGYFREDDQYRQFQFYNVPTKEVILEYVADEDTSGATMIPYAAVEPIRQYAKWQMKENDSRTPLYEKQRAQDQFRYAMAQYSYTNWAFTAEEFLDNAWSSSRSSPKR